MDDRLVPVGRSDALHHPRAEGVAAAFFFSRGTGHTRRVHWLKWILAIVGALWLGGISFWAAGLVDQIKTDI
jgi:hypothetical protein